MLALAERPIGHRDLLRSLAGDEVRGQDAGRLLVGSLIRHGFPLTDLRPSSHGNEAVRLLARLESIPDPSSVPRLDESRVACQEMSRRTRSWPGPGAPGWVAVPGTVSSPLRIDLGLDVEVVLPDQVRVAAARAADLMVRVAPPDDIAAKCVALTRSYGLNFSTSDFIVTPDGRYVYLETNPNGQWLWVQERVPSLRMKEAFTACFIRGANS